MRYHSGFALLVLSCAVASTAPPATIPDYVKTYAPLVYLDQNEVFFPSDIGAQVVNTFPDVNFTTLRNASSNLSLDNLAELNSLGPCTSTSSCEIFLTSKTDVTRNPSYLFGVLPDPHTFKTAGAISSAVIVHDHGNGVVDAFYMYFYAFNQGLQIIGQVQGDHVGDWEHSAIRFQDGKPISVWLSQHDFGQAFTYNALLKNGSRPIIYSAIGSHANFAVSGTHSRNESIPGGPVMNVSSITLDDFTSNGAIWDPLLSTYYYTFTPSSPSNGTFTPGDSSTPVSWLYYLGHWGDKQYPDSDPRQVDLLNLHLSFKFSDGPTGPLAKGLDRSEICPDRTTGSCVTSTALPAVSGTSISVTVTRTTATATATGGGGGVSGTGRSSVPSASLVPSPGAAGHVQLVMGAVLLQFFTVKRLKQFYARSSEKANSAQEEVPNSAM
ncbi:hypothetical protein B7463_g9875, partial [Scytalidium lignicola]